MTLDDELRRTVSPDLHVPGDLSQEARQGAMEALRRSRRSDRLREMRSWIAGAAGVLAILGLLAAALPRGDRAQPIPDQSAGLGTADERPEPGKVPLGTAMNGEPVGVTRTAINLPVLTETTRPQVLGRRVVLSERVRAEEGTLNDAFTSCMLANGATRIENAAGGGGFRFDDPGLAAQAACAAELSASEAFGESPEARVAHLAQAALKLEIERCLADRGSGSLESAPDQDFKICVATATGTIEETGSVSTR